MFFCGIRCVPRVAPVVRNISSSSNLCLDQKWREMQGLPDNPNRMTTLRDLHDFSFVDGKPTPYGSRQRLRILKQREHTAKIIELTQEVDYAVQIHAQLQQQQEDEVKMILSKKLKKKGKKKLET